MASARYPGGDEENLDDGTSRPSTCRGESQTNPTGPFVSSETWPEINVNSPGGNPLAVAKLMSEDHRFQNHPLFRPLISWLLLESASELREVEKEVLELFRDVPHQPPKEKEEQLRERKKALIKKCQALAMERLSMMSLFGAVSGFDKSSRSILEDLGTISSKVSGSILSPKLDSFLGKSPATDFRLFEPRTAASVFMDAVLGAVHVVVDFVKHRGNGAGKNADQEELGSTLLRGPWERPVNFLFGLIIAIFFLAPMPFLVFRALPAFSTMIMLFSFQIFFGLFLSIDGQPDSSNSLLISLAYGGLLWSCASNWLSPVSDGCRC